MSKSVHLLVIRFSALGDIAMTVPVLQQLLEQHPDVRLTVVSQPLVAPLFESLPRTEFLGINPAKSYPGWRGVFQLFQRLRQAGPFDAVADLHQVLRTQIISTLFRLFRVRVAVINKGRADRKKLTRKTDKVMQPITTVSERYAAVFADLGYPIQLSVRKPVLALPALPESAAAFFSQPVVLGLAPFAQHEAKRWPVEHSKQLAIQLAKAGHQVLLFGAPNEEAHVLEGWTDPRLSIHVIAGRFTFREELAIIARLHTMISMDSANMHLAALFGVRVVSLWGATHPFAGFYGWALEPSDIVQDEQLSCRPCSVFGNKACYRGDYACWKSISVESVLARVIG